MNPQIRLLQREQSDLGAYCLQYKLADKEADNQSHEGSTHTQGVTPPLSTTLSSHTVNQIYTEYCLAEILFDGYLTLLNHLLLLPLHTKSLHNLREATAINLAI